VVLTHLYFFNQKNNISLRIKKVFTYLCSFQIGNALRRRVVEKHSWLV